MIELKYIKDEEESLDACEKQLDEKFEMIKNQLVMLRQESRIICTEDEALKRRYPDISPLDNCPSLKSPQDNFPQFFVPWTITSN